MPLMQLKMLVLPAPFGPMIARNSPSLTVRLTPANAATPPKWRCIPSRLSDAIPPPARANPVTRGRMLMKLGEATLNRGRLSSAPNSWDGLRAESELADRGGEALRCRDERAMSVMLSRHPRTLVRRGARRGNHGMALVPNRRPFSVPLRGRALLARSIPDGRRRKGGAAHLRAFQETQTRWP